MSDFDKEAEREKLRKQFAEDDRKRASTERMSELLLKGATMTNKHCDVCGDPIFRWQDEEFCPTCTAEGRQAAEERAAERGAAEQRPAGEEPTASRSAETDGDPAAAASSSADETIAPEDVEVEPLDRPGSPGRPGPLESPESPESSEPSATTRSAGDPPSGARETAASPPTPRASPDTGTPGGRYADLSAARESLARTVTRFAEEAEAADDLARAREFLGAVGDAADALAAVRRAERR